MVSMHARQTLPPLLTYFALFAPGQSLPNKERATYTVVGITAGSGPGSSSMPGSMPGSSYGPTSETRRRLTTTTRIPYSILDINATPTASFTTSSTAVQTSTSSFSNTTSSPTTTLTPGRPSSGASSSGAWPMVTTTGSSTSSMAGQTAMPATTCYATMTSSIADRPLPSSLTTCLGSPSCGFPDGKWHTTYPAWNGTTRRFSRPR